MAKEMMSAAEVNIFALRFKSINRRPTARAAVRHRALLSWIKNKHGHTHTPTRLKQQIASAKWSETVAVAVAVAAAASSTRRRRGRRDNWSERARLHLLFNKLSSRLSWVEMLLLAQCRYTHTHTTAAPPRRRNKIYTVYVRTPNTVGKKKRKKNETIFN